MLYKKKNEPHLDLSLFREPTAEYRGTPFWAWNCRLEEKELVEQIDVLKEMGFGGFHMHSRAGMGSTYLGDEFMHMVRACTEKAKKEKMLAWLYDEDRWPSGSAGGYVTKDRSLRGRYLLFTVHPSAEATEREVAIREGGTYLLAVYDILLDDKGRLTEYRRINDEDAAVGEKWYVYVCTNKATGWYNGEAYVDTLSKEAMRRFIDITYTAYEKEVGADFDGAVPAIFTDEPQFVRKTVASFGASREETQLPFTPDFSESYFASYGEDLLAHLPELRWDNADGSFSVTRYRYHDHVCERFCTAFVDQCGAWCDEHGIALTGHMMEEPTLESQTHSLGEAMRCYRRMALPGIDLLCDRTEYSTAKQCQSAVHQYGREGMLSELYGVTGWHFDFRSHKFQGDWQAALGVTIRVPHLSWVTMKGSGKRDYPASINYQAPWYREYRLIEDHFARLATVLTRGKPIVRVGVIHPIESFWMVYGPSDTSSERKKEREEQFSALIERLLFGLTDFDFISESLLPSLYAQSDDKRFAVGEMAYDAVIVPELITIRSETLHRLTEFADKGGKLIFIGSAPTYVDGIPSDAALPLYRRSLHTSAASLELLSLLDEEKELKVFGGDGAVLDDLVYTMRETEEERYLFLARGRRAPRLDADLPRDVFLHVRGSWCPTLLNTQTGEEQALSYRNDGKETILLTKMAMSDSLLLRLVPAQGEHEEKLPAGKAAVLTIRPQNEHYQPSQGAFVNNVKNPVTCVRTEPNVLVLDMAKWSEDGVRFHETEEILRIDQKLREVYGYPMADGKDVQPWVIPDEPIEKFPVLQFRFLSKIAVPLTLAYEELCEADLNGEKIPVRKEGFYVDHYIHTMSLPACRAGENILTLRVPIGKRVSIENFFLLGDFDVCREDGEYLLCAPSNRVGFGLLTEQGMPFYGGNVTYAMTFNAPRGRAEIRISHYRGALMRVYLDGKDMGALIYAPYTLEVPALSEGEHTLEILLYGNRANTFGALHMADETVTWLGPRAWYTEGAQYSYEYNLKPFGILAAPVITVFPEK